MRLGRLVAMAEIEQDYRYWLEHANAEETKELEALHQSSEDLQDAFYRELSFGTAGLRGIIGIGPNRMNIHTIGKATQGLANCLVAHFEAPSVCIARDSRRKGETFVKAAASVLAANGVHVFVFPEIQPTPTLSFAVRDLGCSAGINVTASHNPAEYSGYKVYGQDGCQIASDAASEIQESIDTLAFFDDVKSVDFDSALDEGLIEWIGDDCVDRFIDAVAAQSVEDPNSEYEDKLKVVYTPLNGTGLKCVLRILERVGIDDVTVVPEQRDPDGNFPTCPYPNPEDRAALSLGLKLCDEVKPDILLATDPDADRVGIAIPHNGEYVLLSGNEVGVLLIDYLCQRRKDRGEDLSRKLAVTTIVSSLMPDAQAEEFGFELRRVLTGFKYIGGQIALLENSGRPDDYMFGFEESYGYMSGTHVRDKDAVNACMLICQMAQWHKSRGFDLVEAMDQLYQKYGYYLNKTVNISYPGSAGAAKMSEIMHRLRIDPPKEIAGLPVQQFTDFANGVAMPVINPSGEKQTLPKADVLAFSLDDGVKVLIRPSGTEPKIKAYVFAKGASRAEAQEQLDMLAEAATQLLG